MNRQETFICLRDALTQDKQMALDKLIVKFGIENVFQRVVGKDETNTVCYPFPDTYIEVVFSDNKLQSLCWDERLLLDDIGNALGKIMERTLGLTSRPYILDNGSAIYQIGYYALSEVDNNGNAFADYMDAVNKGNQP